MARLYPQGRRGFFLLCTFLAFPLVAQTVHSPIVTELQTSTVTIITYNGDDEPVTKGCGFFTGSTGELVTSRHVVKECHHARVLISDGPSYPVARVLSEDIAGDLIKLKVDISSTQPLPVSSTVLKEGERIMILGPEGELPEGRREVIHGEVSGVRNIQGFGNIIEITAPLTPGFSGSPVINQRGDIVGIVSLQVIGCDTVNFAVPSERLNHLVLTDTLSVAQWNARIRTTFSKEELYLEGVRRMWNCDWETALACFYEVVDESPLYLTVYPLIGYCNLELGRWQAAIDAYYQSLLIDPDDALAYNNIAIGYGNLDRWGEAMASYRQAARISPYDPAYRCGLGMAYAKVGQWGQAMACFEYAIELDPGFAAAHYGLGLSCWVFEDMEAAWEEYRILRQLDDDLADDLFEYIQE